MGPRGVQGYILWISDTQALLEVVAVQKKSGHSETGN
jgi:hypothetical protein